MIFHDVEQGSDTWFSLRRGIPTASEFSRIITPAKGQTGGPGSRSYIANLIGERLALHLPVGAPSYTSRAMDHGREFEAEARRLFSFETNLEIGNGGFCQTDDKRFGSSPDGLLGTIAMADDPNRFGCAGALELKCPQPETHAGYLLDGDILPQDYKYQVHGHLLVTGAPCCWFMSYCPGMRPLLLKIEPDETTEKLRAALEEFHGRLIEALAKVRGN